MPNTIMTQFIFGIIIAIPLVMVIAGQVAEVMLLCAAILVLFTKNKQNLWVLSKNFIKKPIIICLLLFLSVIVLHIFTDKYPLRTFNHLSKIILIFISASIVGYFFKLNYSIKVFQYLAYAIIVASVISFLVLIYARYNIKLFPFYHFNRLAITNALWLLPVIYALKNQPKLAGLTAFSVVLLASISVSSTSVVALIFAITGFVVVYYALKWGVHSLFFIALITFLLAPWLGKLPIEFITKISFMKSSGYHRLHIWDAYSTLAQIKPLWGWGFDAGRYSFTNETIRALFTNPDEKLAFHPHAQQIQLWFELGFLSIISMASLIILMWKNLLTWERMPKAIASGSFAATLITISVNFSIWQLWFLAVVAIQIIFCLTVNTHRSGETTI